MSDFKSHISTIFLTPQYSQEEDRNNGANSGQIGPQEPSGLILTVFDKNLLCFRSRALSLILIAILFKLGK